MLYRYQTVPPVKDREHMRSQRKFIIAPNMPAELEIYI